MYFLIEVDDPADIGKDEQVRILIRGKKIDFNKNSLGEWEFSATGTEVHPATKED